MKKEELQKQVAVLETANQHLIDQDERLRTEFSKTLGNYSVDENTYLNGKKRLVVYSWFEIFAELGKLLKGQKKLNYVEDVGRYRQEVLEVSIEIDRLRQELLKQNHEQN